MNNGIPYLEPVHGREEVRKAFETMRRVLATDDVQERNVGTPAGVRQLTVYWHDLGSWGGWCAFDDPDARPKRNYWNSFGIGGRGEDSSLSPAAEINPPRDGGINRLNGGAFLRSGDGRICLAHTGSITTNSGRRAMRYREFVAEFRRRRPRWPVIEVVGASGRVPAILIDGLLEPDFRSRVFAFVKNVKAIKDHFRSR